MKTPLVILISAALALARILGVKHEAYQAVAHLWVGGLIGAWLLTRKTKDVDSVYLWSVIVLSVVEVACFIVQHWSAIEGLFGGLK